MKYLAIIPARGGSKGIPGKNIRPIAGKPLISWTIEAALAVPALDRIVVTTDDEDIAKVAQAHGVEVVMRPAELAADNSPTIDALQHAVKVLGASDSGAVVTLQPTSPLRRAEHIEGAIAMFESDAKAESLVTTIEVPHIFHPISVMKAEPDGYLRPVIEGQKIYTRQLKGTVYARNGAAIYITRMSCLSQFVFGGRLIGYPMSLEDSIDIDEETDFLKAEDLLLLRQSNRGEEAGG